MPMTRNTPTVFGDCAPVLVDHGYPVVPCVQHDKRPAVSDWLAYEYTPGEYLKNSCGILTGRGLVGIDIDITEEDKAETTRDLLMDLFGDTVYRVGQAPKTLLLYRAPAGIRKAKVDVPGGHVEILGEGQQFVAYGIHKDTHAPYEWPSVLGGPLEVRAEHLPYLSLEDLQKLLNLLGRDTARVTQMTGDTFELHKPPVGLLLEEMAAKIADLDADGRDSWLRVGMALHHEYNGSDESLRVWVEWSRKSSKFVEGECEKFWEGFGAHAGSRVMVTARSVLHEARVKEEQARADAAKATFLMLQADIEGCADVDTLRGSIAQDMRNAEVPEGMRITLRQAFARKYHALTGEKLGKSDAATLTDPQGVFTHELTEIGNAARLVGRYGKQLMYCPETAAWYRWDGGRWLPCVGEIVARMAADTVAHLSDEAEGLHDTAAKAIYKWQAASSRAAMLDNMARIARMAPEVMVHADVLDADTDLLGCTNGNVHLPTGTLLAPDHTNRITLNTNIPFDPRARCPWFERTVREAFCDDSDMVEFLQRLIGYALLGRPDTEEIMVMPEGKGANGKSTIFNAIYNALGGYARYASAETFVGARGQGNAGAPREDILRLRGARFVYVTELDEGGVLREGFVKAMTGGESMPARGLHAKHTIEVRPTWVSVMPTNHLPIIRGEDKGIWRRIVVIPFRRDFTNDPEIQRDTERRMKLLREAPGVLRWCIEGAAKYLNEGLRPPAQVSSAADNYRGEMDVLSDWLLQCCEEGASFSVTNAELWASWKAHAEREGSERIIRSSSALTRRLDARGYERVRDAGGRGFRGLRIKPIDLF